MNKRINKQWKKIFTSYNSSVNEKEKTSGITLIALVITIIVLLILAGVAISMLTGENGILNRAAKARTETYHAQVKENFLLAMNEYAVAKKDPSEKYEGNEIEYLEENGYIESKGDYYVLTSKLLNGAKTGKGTDKDSGDVYVLEKDSSSSLASIVKVASTTTFTLTGQGQTTVDAGSSSYVLRYYETASKTLNIVVDVITIASDTNTDTETTPTEVTVTAAIRTEKSSSCIDIYPDYDNQTTDDVDWNSMTTTFYGSKEGLNTDDWDELEAYEYGSYVEINDYYYDDNYNSIAYQYIKAVAQYTYNGQVLTGTYYLEKVNCETCNGTNSVSSACDRCEGEGTVNCSKCGGTGYYCLNNDWYIDVEESNEIEQDSDGKYICPICDEKYDSLDDLKCIYYGTCSNCYSEYYGYYEDDEDGNKVFKITNLSQEDGKYQCNDCDKEYDSLDDVISKSNGCVDGKVKCTSGCDNGTFMVECSECDYTGWSDYEKVNL